MSAREFDPHISIDPITHAKDGDYYIKEIEIEHIRRKIETPFKVLAGNGINEEDVTPVSEMIAQPFLEYQKFVTDIRSWNSLYHLLNEAGPDRVHGLDSFFNIKRGLFRST